MRNNAILDRASLLRLTFSILVFPDLIQLPSLRPRNRRIEENSHSSVIASCIYDSNVSFSTFLSLFSTRLWKPRQFPSLLPFMLISKMRKTLGRLSPCMTNVLRSHRIFLVAVIIVHLFDAISAAVSFPSCLIFVDIIVVIIVRCWSRFRSAPPLFCYFILRSLSRPIDRFALRIFFVPSNDLHPPFTSQSLIKPSVYIGRIELVTSIYLHVIYIYVDKSRFQAIFKLSRVDRVRGS